MLLKIKFKVMKNENFNNISFDRILAIGAHPDDVELGCFGTLARYKDNGSKIAIVVLSYGDVGGDSEVRKKESLDSAKILDAKIYHGNLMDTKINDGLETITIIENAIKDFNPTVVIVNSVNDSHQDHRNTSKATISASRFVPTVLFYQTPSSSRSFNSSFFVDITDFMDVKMKAINIHKSQGENVYMADRAVRGLAEFLGFQIYKGGKLFEGFEVHQIII
jgi:LmbE family N-acetylglucosaminyl deacetylase